MKVLHINTYSFGGAFTGAYRLHIALIRNGILSKMLVLERHNDDCLEEVYMYNKTTLSHNLLNRVAKKLGYRDTAEKKRRFYTEGLNGHYEKISFPFSDFDITKSKEYQEADVIHLHWVCDYLDYRSFFKKCDKPVIITLRDMNPILGIFHYEGDKFENLKDFSSIEKKFSLYKIKSIKRFKNTLKIVGISSWITNKSIQSKIYKRFEHLCIPNCIDFKNYALLSKMEARKKLNINNDSIVFSFVSDYVSNKRKGFDLLLSVFNKFPYSERIIIITVGYSCTLKIPFYINHMHLGHGSQSELNVVYAASDAFIFPTREEALGNVMLEAMACGTPVIGTPIGGLLDVIKPGFNGLLSKDVSAEGLKEVILEFIEIRNQFDSLAIRNYIKDNFSEDLVAGKYINLYRKILNN